MIKMVFATILLVEDSTVTRKSIMDNLKNFNFGFLESSTGMAAVVMAKNALPDVILLDLHLPDMDGYDVLQDIRKDPVTSRIPVIIITQSNRTQDVQKCLKGGAQYYLIKPIDTAKLLTCIGKLLDVTEKELTESVLQRDKIMEEVKKKLDFSQQTNKSSTSFNKVEITSSKPGMIIGIPVVLTGGKVLLAPDDILTDDRIKELKRNDIKAIFVKP